MNKVVKFAAFVLATTSLISAGYAKAGDDNGAFPHVDANHNFPPTNYSPVRHSFEIHVPKNSKPISQIVIQVPEVVKWSNKAKDVAVDGNGKKMNANVTINEKTVTLAFAEPVVPNTDLSIDIKNIRRVNLSNGPIYRLSAKFEGSESTMPIGVVRFRVKS